MRRCTRLCLLLVVLLFAIPVLAQDVSEISYESVPNFVKLTSSIWRGTS
jgi:hypothetical protein